MKSPGNYPLSILYCIVCALVVIGGNACTAGQSITTNVPAEHTPVIKNTENPSLPATPLTIEPVSTSTIVSGETNLPIPTATSTFKPNDYTSPATSGCWEEAGQIQELSLRTDLLPLPLEYFLYLPPCYQELPAVSYPVLYLIHGQNFNHDQWARLGVFESADHMIRTGEVPPFMIVLPRDRDWRQPVEDKFGEVLAEELVPWIDNNYRTIRDPQFRAVGGLSRGAGWAVHLGLNYWEIFGAIGGHSLPIFWTDTQHIRTWIDDIPKDNLPKIYLDIGKNDREQILKSAMWFENLLTEKNIPHEWYLNPGYHEESYWQSHLTKYLLWYTGNWWDMYVK